ncbi:DDE-type integrase/transposase/recombinase [Bartonella apis]|uniref:DDE-type integrase/transposase/recombinase n=1 Tax=Bartonella apis TaxID=1686310 RepID=UPI00298E1D90|nr:DDE-type integrase/transposase/recombinase [Bartonella apis]
MFVKIDHVQHYLLRAVYHEAEVPECHVSKKRNIRGVGKFILKSLKKRGYPKIIKTERFLSME